MDSGTDDRRLFDRMVHRYPPKGYELNGYKRWFPKTAEAMLQYLKQFRPLSASEGRALREAEGPEVGFVVVPWVSTPVPWYSIMLAIGLARRGRRVTIFWDDTGFPEVRLTAQNKDLGRVLAQLEQLLPVVRLSAGRAVPPNADDSSVIDSLTDQNLTWVLRGAPPTTDDDRQRAESIRQSLTHSLPLVRSALGDADLDSLVVPGGIYGTSGLFLHVATELGCRAATFDVDWPCVLLCTNGIAAHNADIPIAFDALWNSGEGARRQAIEGAHSEFTRRTEGKDRYGFQVVPAGENQLDDIAALIPMNVEFDSAALGRHVAFANTVDWITATITEVLDADAGLVVVRQHPSERHPLQRSRLDIAAILRDRFGDDARLRFVAAGDPTSTYDLLESARLVLPFVSTISIEAAAMGKPVLISGSCYYDDLGFIWSASTRDEYFELLHRGLRGDLPMLPDQSARAWCCYYLTAVQNRVATEFTAHPDDFWKWCRRAPDSLFADPAVCDILEALDRDVPVALLRHRRHLAEIAP